LNGSSPFGQVFLPKLKDGPVQRGKIKVAGIHDGTSVAALKRIELGYRFVTISSDARLIATGSRQILSAIRDGMPASRNVGY
jgi:ABC-type xylose transport system substrate-binding protein